MDWSNVISFSGGGLVVYALDWYKGKGNVYMEDRILFINYVKDQDQLNRICTFDLTVNLINTSSNAILLREFKASFTYQKNEYLLKSDDRLLEPTYFIEGKKSEEFKFKFCFFDSNTMVKAKEFDSKLAGFTFNYRSRRQRHRVPFTHDQINFSKISLFNANII